MAVNNILYNYVIIFPIIPYLTGACVEDAHLDCGTSCVCGCPLGGSAHPRRPYLSLHPHPPGPHPPQPLQAPVEQA